MPLARFLRVISFASAGPDAPVDVALREAVPRLLDRPEIVDAWIGRRGPAANLTRVLATTWDDEPGPEPHDLAVLAGLSGTRTGAAPGTAAGAARGADDESTRILTVEQVGLRVHARFDRPEPARILRVFRGQVRPGELEPYVEEARTGMLADAAANDGLIAFALGTDDPESFLTVSAWTGWTAIEAATGGNTRRPFATRNSARLTAYTVGHYELLPETPSRHTGADAPTAAPAQAPPDPVRDTS